MEPLPQYRARGPAIIFGATGTIGPAVVRRFAQEGASVAIHYSRSKDVAEQLAAELNQFYQKNRLSAKAITFQANVSDRDDVKRAREQILKEFGEYYYLLLLQDYSITPKLWNLQDPEFVNQNKHRAYEIAYIGSINAIEEFAPEMMSKNRGSILVVGSSAVFDWYELGEYYTVAKTALALVLSEYKDALAKHKVRINGGAWGWVPKGTEDKEEMKKEIASIPLGVGKPEFIADAAFAITNLEWLTGQYILLDGGQASPIPWKPHSKNIEFLEKTGFKAKYKLWSEILGKNV